MLRANARRGCGRYLGIDLNLCQEMTNRAIADRLVSQVGGERLMPVCRPIDPNSMFPPRKGMQARAT